MLFTPLLTVTALLGITQAQQYGGRYSSSTCGVPTTVTKTCTSTVSIPGFSITKTVTNHASVTKTITNQAYCSATVKTVSMPGFSITKTVTNRASCLAALTKTTTLGGAVSTVTSTIAGANSTITTTRTLAAVTTTVNGMNSTITSTVTGANSTITTTQTLPVITTTIEAVNSTITTTETLPVVTTTIEGVNSTVTTTQLSTTTLPAETVVQNFTTTAITTTTATPACVATSVTPNSWNALSAGDVQIGTFPVLSAIIQETNPNLPQRWVQTVAVCPGNSYVVSLDAVRGTDLSGTAYVRAYADRNMIMEYPVLDDSNTWRGSFFASSASTALVIEFVFYNGEGRKKGMSVSNVQVSPSSRT
ncbi:hypothetical protein P153DRAFT_415479 [Dothidotthia symphoricarpi CBS 119687]|uniref:Uncharacterized protein n=1 Tax=Dothidotthia symphoricarpi CBS 119687 TaxID=1392245 RepID=A0A6A6AJW6_9PLEO|nr:uncharacterized protein P153DRAFT_415479 [Dothidotthia symphoricarpi CBS 119687]KAF2132100.1 hypothetical protein P153DRAFT_415479 [Dothidotthia symphoricarpi CBS 119687]